MKALILVGGYGTRLRPLTLSCPKPMIEFCNKPLVLHQIEALVKVGVNHVILAVGYKAEMMESEIKAWMESLNIIIETRVEKTPLGTAGPLALSADVLGTSEESFFVLNSDIICEFPLSSLLEAHKQHGKEGTIAVTKVEEPSKYGVLDLADTEEGLRITRFVEKPSVFVSDKINAGIYILKPAILSRIQLKPTSIEREVFPKMAELGELYAFDMPGFWMDVGQPLDFLQATRLWLEFNPSKQYNSRPNITIHHPVLIEEEAVIGEGCEIGPNVTVGKEVVVGKGVRLVNSVILNNVSIGDSTWISGSIIGWNSRIGKWVRIEPTCVIGQDVSVVDELYVKGCTILPNKEITASQYNPSIIM